MPVVQHIERPLEINTSSLKCCVAYTNDSTILNNYVGILIKNESGITHLFALKSTKDNVSVANIDE